MFEKKNYATKQDLKEVSETIGISFEILKKEVIEQLDNLKQTKTTEAVNNDFLLNSAYVYFGDKNPETEKSLNSELMTLLQKHRVLKITAELFKKF